MGASGVYQFDVELVALLRRPPDDATQGYYVQWKRGSSGERRGLLGPFAGAPDRPEVRCAASFSFQATMEPRSAGGFRPKWLQLTVYLSQPGGARGAKLWAADWDAARALPPQSEAMPHLLLSRAEQASIAFRVACRRTGPPRPGGGLCGLCAAPPPPPSPPAGAALPLGTPGGRRAPQRRGAGLCCGPAGGSPRRCGSPPQRPPPASATDDPPAEDGASPARVAAAADAQTGTTGVSPVGAPPRRGAGDAAPPPPGRSLHSLSDGYLVVETTPRMGGRPPDHADAVSSVSSGTLYGSAAAEVGFLVMSRGEVAATEAEGMRHAVEVLAHDAPEGWQNNFSGLGELEDAPTLSSCVRVGPLSPDRLWRMTFSDRSDFSRLLHTARRDAALTVAPWDTVGAKGGGAAWCGRRHSEWAAGRRASMWGTRKVEEEAYFACFRFAGARLAFLVVHLSRHVLGEGFRVETVYRFVGSTSGSGGHSVQLLVTSKVVAVRRGGCPKGKALAAVSKDLQAEHEAFLSLLTRRAQGFLLQRAGRRGKLARHQRRGASMRRKASLGKLRRTARRRLAEVGVPAVERSHLLGTARSARWGTQRRVRAAMEGSVMVRKLSDYLMCESHGTLGSTARDPLGLSELAHWPRPAHDLATPAPQPQQSQETTQGLVRKASFGQLAHRFAGSPAAMTIRRPSIELDPGGAASAAAGAGHLAAVGSGRRPLPSASLRELRHRPGGHEDGLHRVAVCIDDLPQWETLGRPPPCASSVATQQDHADAYERWYRGSYEQLLGLREALELLPTSRLQREGLTDYQVDRLTRVLAAHPVPPCGHRERPVVLEQVLAVLSLLTLSDGSIAPGASLRLASLASTPAAETLLAAWRANTPNGGSGPLPEYQGMIDSLEAAKDTRRALCTTPSQLRLLDHFNVGPRSEDAGGGLVGSFGGWLLEPPCGRGTLFVTRSCLCFLSGSARAMLAVGDVTAIERGSGFLGGSVVLVRCENRHAGPYDVHQVRSTFRFRLWSASKARAVLRSVVPSRPRFADG
eukprot:TRINITY_DN5104_c0_g2_i1.p1 TRINITY_DN5104_c0_g2~~TRINITY_DN5104_c0_g2_i1.p1  ORF type:complete len:1031 (+),score=215.04 TRINITY_DN5104_c0_g2_i1:189-3281(+)